jgi:hypothetical protein
MFKSPQLGKVAATWKKLRQLGKNVFVREGGDPS